MRGNPTPADGGDEPEVLRELTELVEKAEAGDNDAVAELPKLLQEPALWRHAAELAAAAKAAWDGLLAAAAAVPAPVFPAEAGPLATVPPSRPVSDLERLLADYVEACRWATVCAEAQATLPIPLQAVIKELRNRVAACHRRERLAVKRLDLARGLLSARTRFPTTNGRYERH